MTQNYYNPAVAIGTSGQDALRYGAYQNVANAARDQQRQGLGSARRDMAQQIAGMTSQGANPFGAARAAGRAYEQQAGQIRAQASQQMADAAAMEAQRREQEMLRKQQEARQLIGGGLSTAGAVLGTVIGGPLGSQIGGGIGGAVGGGLTGMGSGPGPARAAAGQQTAKPQMGMAPANVFGGGAPQGQTAKPQMGAPGGAPQSQQPPQQSQQPPQGGGGGMLGGTLGGGGGGGGGGMLGGFANMLNPFSLLGGGR